MHLRSLTKNPQQQLRSPYVPKDPKQLERAVNAAKTALSEFEGTRIPSVSRQQNSLFNPKYQNLSRADASIIAITQSDPPLPSKQNTGKSSSKRHKERNVPLDDDFSLSRMSIDYKHFELPAESSQGSSGVGTTNSHSSADSNLDNKRHQLAIIDRNVDLSEVNGEPEIVKSEGNISKGSTTNVTAAPVEEPLQEYHIDNTVSLTSEQFRDISNVFPITNSNPETQISNNQSDSESTSCKGSYNQSGSASGKEPDSNNNSIRITFNGYTDSAQIVTNPRLEIADGETTPPHIVTHEETTGSYTGEHYGTTPIYIATHEETTLPYNATNEDTPYTGIHEETTPPHNVSHEETIPPYIEAHEEPTLPYTGAHEETTEKIPPYYERHEKTTSPYTGAHEETPLPCTITHENITPTLEESALHHVSLESIDVAPCDTSKSALFQDDINHSDGESSAAGSDISNHVPVTNIDDLIDSPEMPFMESTLI